MEYTIKIAKSNMPEVSISVDADNVLDAVYVKLRQHPEFLKLGEVKEEEIVGTVPDEDSFPVDEFCLKPLDKGLWRVRKDNSDQYVEFKERDFLNTYRVFDSNGELDPRSDVSVATVREAADWVYMLFPGVIE